MTAGRPSALIQAPFAHEESRNVVVMPYPRARRRARYSMLCLLGVVLSVGAPVVASAQNTVREQERSQNARSDSATRQGRNATSSFSELAKLLKPGDVIRVTDASGRKSSGRLGQLSTSSLELLASSSVGNNRAGSARQRVFSEADVESIEVKRQDSVLNGTLIGLGTGVAVGFISGTAACGNYSCEAGPVAAGYAALMGGIGATVGLLADRAVSRRTLVYRSGKSSTDIRVSPVLSKGATGARVSIRF